MLKTIEKSTTHLTSVLYGISSLSWDSPYIKFNEKKIGEISLKENFIQKVQNINSFVLSKKALRSWK